jgi:hypothetical protein
VRKLIAHLEENGCKMRREITVLGFLVLAFSYIPISRPTDATCNRFLFSHESIKYLIILTILKF